MESLLGGEIQIDVILSRFDLNDQAGSFRVLVARRREQHLRWCVLVSARRFRFVFDYTVELELIGSGNQFEMH